MAFNLLTLRHRLILALSMTGFVAASGAQAVAVVGLVDDVQVEGVGIEASAEAVDLSADQPEVAVPYDMVETVDAVMPIAIVDPVVEEPQEVALIEDAVPLPYDLVGSVDDVMPITVVDPVVDETKVIVALNDLPTEVVDDSTGGAVTEVPIEWVMRDDPVFMYSMAGAGGIDDTAEEVASRAAEQAANRSLDQIDAALPESAHLN
jgi:hypothetical protein